MLLYVDDMLVAGSNMQDINVLKIKLAKSFPMKDLGAANQILGMRIARDRKNHKLMLSQGEYIEKVLHRFRMQNAKPVNTPLASHFKLSKNMCLLYLCFHCNMSMFMILYMFFHFVHT